MPKRYYESDLDDTKLKPLADNEGRSNTDKGTGAVEVVLTANIEGQSAKSLVTLPDKRATYYVSQGWAAYKDDYVKTHPDWKPTDGESQK